MTMSLTLGWSSRKSGRHFTHEICPLVTSDANSRAPHARDLPTRHFRRQLKSSSRTRPAQPILQTAYLQTPNQELLTQEKCPLNSADAKSTAHTVYRQRRPIDSSDAKETVQLADQQLRPINSCNAILLAARLSGTCISRRNLKFLVATPSSVPKDEQAEGPEGPWHSAQLSLRCDVISSIKILPCGGSARQCRRYVKTRLLRCASPADAVFSGVGVK